MQVWYCLVHLNSCAIWQTELFALGISFGMTVALVSIWYSLCSLWVSPLCIQPQVHSSHELSSGRLGYKSYICSIHLCSFWGTSQSIQSVPVNKPSELWSCRKVTQVNYQIIFGQPHDTTWLWRTYSAVGRNKLAQISLKLDLMGHRDRSLSQGTWDCCCCFITYAETCAFVKLPLVSCSSSTPDFHGSYLSGSPGHEQGRLCVPWWMGLYSVQSTSYRSPFSSISPSSSVCSESLTVFPYS